MLLPTRNRTNPLFRPDEVERLIGPERARRALDDPDSVDLYVWNVFSTLETHSDEDWLAHRLQPLGGSLLTAPLRVALWSGSERDPLLEPSPGYLQEIKRRAEGHGGTAASLAEFHRPVEVPVRVECGQVLCLVDAVMDGGFQGRGGRDRIVELVDCGLEHARRLGTALAVAVVYRSGTPTAGAVSRRLRQLQEPPALRAAMPHRREVPPVTLREMSWQQLLRLWVQELDFLDVDGLPVRRFVDHCRRRGLLD